MAFHLPAEMLLATVQVVSIAAKHLRSLDFIFSDKTASRG